MVGDGASQLPQVALVTGGTGGLGQAVTRAFLDQGCVVVVTYRSEAEAERTRRNFQAAGDRLALEQADVTDGPAVHSLVQTVVGRFGRVDHLINLVGGWAGGKPVWETGDDELARMLDLNLRSAFVCCRAVLPQMITQNFGRIVNISSRTAVRPSAGAAPYAIGKAGVIVLTETLALEVRDYDVNVNCVLPSVIDTPANRRDMPKADFRRWVTPEQLAGIIVWLTSPAAAPINGTAIPVYGRA
ncbi:MAG: SDR family oxidoreductase [Chloroflexota bacterium]